MPRPTTSSPAYLFWGFAMPPLLAGLAIVHLFVGGSFLAETLTMLFLPVCLFIAILVRRVDLLTARLDALAGPAAGEQTGTS